jgi:hypothetical protein
VRAKPKKVLVKKDRVEVLPVFVGKDEVLTRKIEVEKDRVQPE